MGIPYLNSFIKKNTGNNTLVKIKLKDLYGKVIAIDTSIYLYRFLTEGLLENMYIMISLFRYYNIIPIFVFDGKPPIEKARILEQRNDDKLRAEKQYYFIKEQLKKEKNTDIYKDLYENMIALKKKFVRLKKDDFLKVKSLMSAFGVTYIDAEGEADQLCAKLVIKKYAYACLSEDMDLFVYGCPRVLRYLSLVNKTVILYNLNKILEDLNITFVEFKEICVLSGTDYNVNKINLYKTLEYFQLFKKYNTNYKCFYDWMDNTTNYIDNLYELYNTFNLFRTDNISLKNFKFNNLIKEPNLEKIKEIMKTAGFIFIK